MARKSTETDYSSYRAPLRRDRCGWLSCTTDLVARQVSKARPVATLLAIATFPCVGCGVTSDSSSDLPSDAAARVGGALITRQELHALTPGMSNATPARALMLRYLIMDAWLAREGRRQGLEVNTEDAGTSPAAVRAQKLQVRTTLLTDKLVSRIAGPRPSRQDVARFYREHPLAYGSPEVRYMKRVPAPTRAQATNARRALEAGMSWGGTIDRYADRTTAIPTPKGHIGAQLGEEPPPLDRAIFAARRGALTGPIESSGKWWIFQITRIHRLEGKPLTEARTSIATFLRQRRMERARRTLLQRLRARYRPRTICSEQLLLSMCENGAKGDLGGSSLRSDPL